MQESRRSFESEHLNPRQQAVVERVQREGNCSVDSLALAFDVTPQTIRRDILQLEQLGLLRRYHGGVALHGGADNLAYATRLALLSTEKRRIAELAAKHIPDRSSLFINLGTTTEEVAKALRRHRGLRILTNNLNVAMMMCDFPEAEVTIVGGVVRPRDRGVTGEAAVDLIRQFNVDYAVIGVSSIDANGTLRDFDYREVRVTQAVMAQARQVFLVADHSKFGRPALVRLGDLREIDALFTDMPPPRELQVLLQGGKTTVHVAMSAPAHPLRKGPEGPQAPADSLPVTKPGKNPKRATS